MWRLELNTLNFNCSTCTCPAWLKDGICKHIIGTAIALKLVVPPPRVNQKPLKMPLKGMPRVKAVKALTMQPNYDHLKPSTSQQPLPEMNDTSVSQLDVIESASQNIDALSPTNNTSTLQFQPIQSTSRSIDPLPTNDTAQPNTPAKPIQHDRRSKSAMKLTDPQENLKLPPPSTPTTPIARSFALRGRKRVQMQSIESPKVENFVQLLSLRSPIDFCFQVSKTKTNTSQIPKKLLKNNLAHLKSGQLLAFGAMCKQGSLSAQYLPTTNGPYCH